MAITIVKLRYVTETQRAHLFEKYNLTTEDYAALLPRILLSDPAVQALRAMDRVPQAGDIVVEVDEQAVFRTPYVITND